MARARREPVRTCVACRREALKPDLVRVVRDAAGAATLDPTGHAPGRGAYLHRDVQCVENARRRRQLERTLGASVPASLWSDLIA